MTTTQFTDRDFLKAGLRELAVRLEPAAKPWKLRKRVEEVRRLRTGWAERLTHRCGLRVVGLHEGRWIRRLNEEHFELYVARLAESGIVVPKETPLMAEVEEFCLPAVGQAVSE